MEPSPGATDVSVSAHLRKAEKSTLESDVELLKCMQSLSQKMVSQADKLVRELQQLEKDSIAACVGVENCVQNLNLISTKQYMEKRVYDEEIKESKEDTPAATPSTSNDPPDFVPKIKEALSHVLPVLRTNREQAAVQNGGKHIEKLHDSNYSLRPLPWIVGTSDFLDCPLVGLPFYCDEQNGSSDSTTAPVPNALPISESNNMQSSSTVLQEDSETEEFDKPPELTVGPTEEEQIVPEVETEPPVSDRQTESQPTFAVLQKELASRLKIPVLIPTEIESDSEQVVESDNEDRPSQPQLPNFSQTPVALPKPEQQYPQQQQQYQQQAIKKRRTLFDDSSESDDDDLFKASSSKPVQSSAPKTIAPNPVPVQVPVLEDDDLFEVSASNPVQSPAPKTFTPNPMPVPVPTPAPIQKPETHIKPSASKPTISVVPAPTSATSAAPIQSSISPPSTAPGKPSNGGPSGRSFLFDSSDDDDDIFATSKPVTKTVPSQPPVDDDDDDDLFSDRSITYKKPVTTPTTAPTITPPNAPAAANKSQNEGMKSQSLFDDNDDVSKIFPISSTPQKLAPTVAAPTTSTAPSAGPTRVVASSLFGNDSDSDDDIFKNIIPKKPAAVKVPPTVPEPLNRPVESLPTPKVNPQVENHASQRLDSPVQKTSFPPDPASIATPKMEPKPLKSDVSPVSPPLVSKNESIIQKANVSSESDGKSTSVKRPTTLALSDDSDDDLFKPRPASKVPVAPAVLPVPASKEEIADVGFLKTPELEEKQPVEPPSPADRSGGLVASLKISLAKQPMGMLSPPSSAQTPSTPGMRKPFAGVPIFGMAPTSPLAPVANQTSPQHEEAPVSQATGDESLPCMGRDRPRAPKHRRLPSRSHRRSMIIEEEVPADQIDGEQVPNGSYASTPVSPKSVAEIQVPIADKPVMASEPVRELPVPINDQFTSLKTKPVAEESAPKTTTETPSAVEHQSSVKSEPLAPVLTKESKATVHAVAEKSTEKPKTSLFNDSDDSSDGELFAKLTKPASVSRVTDSQTKSAKKVETVAPPAPVPAPAKANTQSLFGEESDSDDGLFASRKVTTTPAAAAVKKPSGLQAFADSDSDDDDLFTSKPTKRGPPDKKESAKAAVEHASPAVISDPLLGFHNQ